MENLSKILEASLGCLVVLIIIAILFVPTFIRTLENESVSWKQKYVEFISKETKEYGLHKNDIGESGPINYHGVLYNSEGNVTDQSYKE